MKNIIRGISKHKIIILLWLFIIAYIIYFSYLTVLRYKTLYASYFDLGIMNQTVYNTYKAIVSGDPSRFLELTNPFGPDQIKRMAIHNDMFLALLAPFYIIHAGPSTLLIIQTIVLALGAFFIFKIAQNILCKTKNCDWLCLMFAIAYLFYPSLQRTNLFDFHPVVLTTTFLLASYYFLLIKRYWPAVFFIIFSLLTKEEVALTTAFLGIYSYVFLSREKKDQRSKTFSIIIVLISIVWFILSMYVIIPYFRGDRHFALSYYENFGSSPVGVIIGILKNPYSLLKYVVRTDTLRYLLYLLGPVGFLSLFSPIPFLISLPELTINLLSSNANMTNIIYHYTAVITPFIFIAAIYGASVLIKKVKRQAFIMILITVCTLIFAYFKGPLPFSKEKEVHPFLYPQVEAADVAFWAQTLKDENLKITTTGQLAPFFTNRRYFYTFASWYGKSDYVVIRKNEIYNYPEKDVLIPVYEKLEKDKNFKLIYDKENFKVYKKITL